jgi:hypothetical protein
MNPRTGAPYKHGEIYAEEAQHHWLKKTAWYNGFGWQGFEVFLHGQTPLVCTEISDYSKIPASGLVPNSGKSPYARPSRNPRGNQETCTNRSGQMVSGNLNVTEGRNVSEMWQYIFRRNEGLALDDRLTDPEIAEIMAEAFPDRNKKRMRNVVQVRSDYNAGRLACQKHTPPPPNAFSFRYVRSPEGIVARITPRGKIMETTFSVLLPLALPAQTPIDPMQKMIERRKETLTPVPSPSPEARTTISEAAKNFRDAHPDLLPKNATTLRDISNRLKESKTEPKPEPDNTPDTTD